MLTYLTRCDDRRGQGHEEELLERLATAPNWPLQPPPSDCCFATSWPPFRRRRRESICRWVLVRTSGCCRLRPSCCARIRCVHLRGRMRAGKCPVEPSKPAPRSEHRRTRRKPPVLRLCCASADDSSPESCFQQFKMTSTPGCRISESHDQPNEFKNRKWHGWPVIHWPDRRLWLNARNSETIKSPHWGDQVAGYLTNLPKSSLSSCSSTNWPKLATNSVEHGALAPPISVGVDPELGPAPGAATGELFIPCW